MPLPAIQLLGASCPIKPAWAVFDSNWYRKKYAPGETRDMLEFYLQSGCRAGHSPSCLFDEPFYLSRNPDVALLVAAGHFRSGFDHFCQYGYRGHSPHWLFDDAYYGKLYDDMTVENLDLNGFHGRYDHFLQAGQREHRSPHPLFDGRFYRTKAIAAGEDGDAIDTLGVFTHYLARLQTDASELPPSIYFDPAWVVQQLALGEAAAGCSAIEHYLCHATPDLIVGDPVAEFSERFYLENNPDVRHLIAAGHFRSGYHHFITYGAFELRRPCADVDLFYYRDANSQVRNDLNTGQARDAFAHLRSVGLRLGLAAAPAKAQPLITEAATKQLFIAKARANLALFGRRKLDFVPAAKPILSVVMVLFEKFELTMLSLCALRDNYSGAIELILIDNASSDATPRIGDFVEGAKIHLLARNTGYALACNLGLAEAGCPYVLLLNNDVELGHGAIAAAIARMQSDGRIGAVGGKIIRTHGRLQEAGSIIWDDGDVSGYMRDASPLAPEANFLRDVDFCSGVFLLCRAALIESLGGFDTEFSPAYYEDVDLCIRIAAAGYRVVYDPAVVVHHLEYGSAENTQASTALMRRGRQTLVRKHQPFLKGKLPQAPANIIRARGSDEFRKRVLFIEDTVPLRHLGSGYVRANDVVRAISNDTGVSVFPLNGAPYDIMSIYADFPDHVEILHDRDAEGLAQLLEARAGYYDCIWISRTHNLNRILPILLAAGIDPERTKLVLDTEAIATFRDAGRAKLAAEPFDFEANLRAEFANAGCCRQIITVSRAEAECLRDLGLPEVAVLGTMRAPQPTGKSFSAREGLLFVAAIHQPDSPNLDALHWYADEILPALAAEMNEVPLLTVAGYIGPEIDLSRFNNHQHIRIHGPARDLQPFYDRSRVFIAPTRFAAGTAYKLVETSSFGLPAVATDLLAGQLEWRSGVELLAAPVGDAKTFAAQIAQLYRSERLWRELRTNALLRLTNENPEAAFNAAVSRILRSIGL
jgi:GT2 family glycosyltransferase